MTLPKNPYLSRGIMKSYQYSGYEKAQQDMIAAGYRPTKSVEEIEEKLCELEYKWPLNTGEMAEMFRAWWLEGDKE